MSSTWTSAIAVIGTLLGSTLTYLFQRMTLNRTIMVARGDKRREEFIDALATYASTVTALRRAEFDRAKKRLGGVVAQNGRRRARRHTACGLKPVAHTTSYASWRTPTPTRTY